MDRRDWVWWRVIKSYAHKSSISFIADLSLRICPTMFWGLVIFSIFLKNVWSVWENVVDLQNGAQIRVLPLLDVLIIILNKPVTAAVSSDSFQLLTYWYCLVALLPVCRCYYWCGQNWMVLRNLIEDACLPRMLTKVRWFYCRAFSTDLPYYYVLSPSNIQYIIKKIVVHLSKMS